MTTTAFERITGRLADAGKTVAHRGDGRVSALCPAHDDGSPSLSVGPRRDGKGVVLHCHAGCSTEDVLGALGLSMGDLFNDPKTRAIWSPRCDYRYPDGRVVHRKPGKQFRQSGNTTGRALFHADHIDGAEQVFVVEGERDVLAVEAAGGTAVCNAMGAGKGHQFDWSPLHGKTVRIIADKDTPGRKHANQVAELFAGIARSVQIVEPASGKDAADHIAAGLSLDEFKPTERTDSDPDGKAGNELLPRIWRATDLKPAAQPRWLAKGRLQRGATNLLVGAEGIGKSLLWVWVAAAVSTGKPLSEFGIPERDPAHVLLVCTEDDWCSTVRPRLEVAGADLAMISVICTDSDGSGVPVFPRDLFLIAGADPPPALIVVDAWLDTVAAGLSVRDPQQARVALHPWKELAGVTGAAVLLICHTNRVSSASARDRYGATYALRQKARMSLYAQCDDDGRLLVGPEKMNNGAPVRASVFTITAVQHFEPTDDDDGTVPLLAYAEESDRTAGQHVADDFDDEHSGEDDRHARDVAVEWLQDYLQAEGPAAGSSDVKKAAAKAGISVRTLQRACKKLKVVYGRSGFAGDTKVTWTLPVQHGATGATGATGEDKGIAAGQASAPFAPQLRHETDAGVTVAQLWDQHKHGENRQSRQLRHETDAVAPMARIPGFALPTGPDRCDDCGFHTTTQGHRDTCPANERTTR
jgi:RecA-family ATPase